MFLPCTCLAWQKWYLGSSQRLVTSHFWLCVRPHPFHRGHGCYGSEHCCQECCMFCKHGQCSSRARGPHSRDWSKIFLHHFWILEQIQNKPMVSPNLRQFTLATNTPTERVLRFIYLSFPYLVLILNKEETMLDGKPMSKDIWIKEFVLSTHFPSTVAKESFLLCSESNGALHIITMI